MWDQFAKDLKKQAREAPEEEQGEQWAAKSLGQQAPAMRDDKQGHFPARSKGEEKKVCHVDIGELDTSTEEDVWEGMGEHEADGGSRGP